MRAYRLLLLWGALLLVVSCGKPGLTFEQFVNATVELRRAADRSHSAAEYETRKRAIEARLGVTDASLRSYVREHAGDVKLMSAAWDSVEARLERASKQDAITRPTPQPATPGGTPPAVTPPKPPRPSTTPAAPPRRLHSRG